jgi:hypothetical protein
VTEPIAEPLAEPLAEPTIEPTPEPTAEPTDEPTPEPTATVEPTPTSEPTPTGTATSIPPTSTSVIILAAPPATEIPLSPTPPAPAPDPEPLAAPAAVSFTYAWHATAGAGILALFWLLISIAESLASSAQHLTRAATRPFSRSTGRRESLATLPSFGSPLPAIATVSNVPAVAGATPITSLDAVPATCLASSASIPGAPPEEFLLDPAGVGTAMAEALPTDPGIVRVAAGFDSGGGASAAGDAFGNRPGGEPDLPLAHRDLPDLFEMREPPEEFLLEGADPPHAHTESRASEPNAAEPARRPVVTSGQATPRRQRDPLPADERPTVFLGRSDPLVGTTLTAKRCPTCSAPMLEWALSCEECGHSVYGTSVVPSEARS